MSSRPSASLPVLVVLASLMATALAGCLAPDLDRAPGTPPRPSLSVAEEADADHQSAAPPASPPGHEPRYDADDWFLLSTPRSPSGHVRAFEWQIPDGAVYNVSGGPPFPMMYLEFVPTAARFAPGEDWTLYGFRDNDGTAELLFALIGATATTENLSATPASVHVTPPPHYGATLLVAAQDLAAGDHLHFILVGYGPTTGELGFAFRIADTESPTPPAAAQNLAEFLADETGPPVTMEPEYDGDGSYDAYYRERIIPNGEQYRVATDTIDHHTITIANAQGSQVVRQETTSVAQDRTGWSLVHAAHEAFAEAGYWTLDIAAQEATGRANGGTMDDPLGVTSTTTTRSMGQPLALFMADGPGESRVQFTLDRASAGSATTVQHHQLPDTLETIIGVPSATLDGISTGDAGGLPWVGPLPPS